MEMFYNSHTYFYYYSNPSSIIWISSIQNTTFEIISVPVPFLKDTFFYPSPPSTTIYVVESLP